MAYAIGKLPEYSEGEDWSEFIELLDAYFSANGVADNNAQKRSVLITVWGAKIYSLIKNLVSTQ